MSNSLPTFTYATDQHVQTMFASGPATCDCCQKATQYRYTGRLYRRGNSKMVLCPWCIHDGSAALNYQASFNDLYDESVDAAIAAEVCERTPGYSSWQDQRWATHCGDACVFHGDASAQDVANASDETRQAWMDDYQQSAQNWAEFMQDYQPGGDQGVYKFVCRHCGLVKFNWDFS